MKGRGLLLPLAVGAALACGRRAATRGEPTSSPIPRSEAGAVTSAAKADAPVEDPEEASLRRPIARLVARRGPAARPGIFDARLTGDDRPAVAEPALLSAPTAYRAPLAYYLLAKALGMRVVPATVVRAVPLADLGAAEGDAQALLGDLRVQNDGSVDVLLRRRVEGKAFDPRDDHETATWDRWAASASPAAGEDGALLRDYVEVRVLDYLAADQARPEVLRTGSGLALADNASAFPPRVDPPTLDRMLRRLRSFARFPRGLRDALARFDRERAQATFTAGRFEGWLLSPRAVVELDERRAALLTLIEARVAERGAAAVLSL